MAQPRTRLQKFKDWSLYYAPEIIVGTVTTIFIGGTVLLVRHALKTEMSERNKAIEEYNAYAQEMNDWIDAEKEAGNAIYILDDGAYLVVPETADTHYVVK